MKILISHATEDERPAALLKELIERCSLKQIEVWFSSDQSAAGGIPPGASWFSDLLIKLSATDLIVALITPRSSSSPWLYFECGMVANKGKGAIVPLTLGLSIADLPMPLSAYQGYDLSASSSVATFLQKLFALASVPYDEDMTKGIRENVTRALFHASEEATPRRAVAPAPVGKAELDDLKGYLDKRFLELHARLQAPSAQPLQESVKLEALPPSMVASLRFDVVDENRIVKEFRVDLDPDSSIQDVLNECYYKMDGLVPAYHYLERWVVVENHTGKHLMSEGHADDAPASVFFSPAQSYSISLLDKPIDPDASSAVVWIDTSKLHDLRSVDGMDATLGAAQPSGVPVMHPIEAIAGATKNEEGIVGTFEFVVKGGGEKAGVAWINSESDYRDPICLSVALLPGARKEFIRLHNAEPADLLLGKRIRVSGSAKKHRVEIVSGGGAREGLYYFQTHVYVTNLSQITVLNSSVGTEKPN